MTHRLWCSIVATCTRFHQTEAHGSPEANDKLNDAENQNDYNDSPCVSGAIESTGYAVADDNYATKHSRCNREAHKHTSLGFKQDH